MIDEDFKLYYERVMKRCCDFGNYTSLIGLLKRLNHLEDDGFELVKWVENDLIDKGILSFKIEGYGDLGKIEPIKTEEDIIQWYIWLTVVDNEKKQRFNSPSLSVKV